MKVFLVVLSFFLSLACNAQTKIGNQDSITLPTIYFAGNTVPFVNGLIYVPSDYSTSKTYPLIFNLAGDDQRGVLKNLFTATSVATEIKDGWIPQANGQKFIVYTPILPATNKWSWLNAVNLKPMLAELKKRYSIDASRVYFTGLSAGGYAAYGSVLEDSALAKQIAAIVPVSALANGSQFINIKKYNIGVWAICGDGDPHYRENVTMIDSINKYSLATLTTLKGYGHNNTTWQKVFDPNYRDNGKNIYEWMLQYSSNAATTPLVDKTKNNTVIVTPRVNAPHKWYPTSGWLNSLPIQPGDTIFLSPAVNWDVITLQHFKGDPLHPVIIINKSGQAILTGRQSGFQLQGSVGIHITGTGDKNIKYGIKINGGNFAGISVEGRAAYQEFDHIDISNKGIAFWVKTEQTLADSLSFPNWVMHHFKIHDNYIHNTSLEGMYLGSTDPNAVPDVNNQHPLKDTIHKPLRLGVFEIYNNVIDSTGRGGIQLSNADSGTSEIYNNTISNNGYEHAGEQGDAISLGGYTQAYVHNNRLRKTFSNAIFSVASGNIIENNDIDSTGYLNTTLFTKNAYSIYLDVRPARFPSPQHYPYDSTQFILKNNKTDKGIFVEKSHNTYKKTGNIICNNTGSVYVRPGINYTSNCKH